MNTSNDEASGQPGRHTRRLPAGYEPDKDLFGADLYPLMDLAG